MLLYILLYILIYVYDLIIMDNSTKQINAFINSLNNKFALKDFGQLNYFLEVEATYFFLSQNT